MEARRGARSRHARPPGGVTRRHVVPDQFRTNASDDAPGPTRLSHRTTSAERREGVDAAADGRRRARGIGRAAADRRACDRHGSLAVARVPGVRSDFGSDSRRFCASSEADGSSRVLRGIAHDATASARIAAPRIEPARDRRRAARRFACSTPDASARGRHPLRHAAASAADSSAPLRHDTPPLCGSPGAVRRALHDHVLDAPLYVWEQAVPPHRLSDAERGAGLAHDERRQGRGRSRSGARAAARCTARSRPRRRRTPRRP
jgi:hypothetical protein